MKHAILFALFLLSGGIHGQTVFNISCTSNEAAQVMQGIYDPSSYTASSVIDDHETIICALRTRVSADSLKANLQKLETFQTRHTYSDTVSNSAGIGAARRWAYSRFQAYSAANEDRLIPAYIQFDNSDTTCGSMQGFRNVIAVLPGSNVSTSGMVLIEGHMDSRCAGDCDTDCFAPGMEDNGSGTALVMELARVMSAYTFDHTLVFMLTVGEEQGLLGAEAMAQWCEDNNVPIKAVQNNDVIGGILCGQTSSPPSCPSEGHVDSLQVRLFSNSNISAGHRSFARTIKMFYQEKLQQEVPVPMTVSIMAQEDRTGRGGDHIPFRVKGYRNVRFTSANEHGDAAVDSSWYADRQHTSDDILGVDTDGDMLIDSFFVDFNYLQRNAVINGMSATLLALGPDPPEFILHDEPTGLRVEFTSGFDRLAYRVGVRNGGGSLDFDAVYRTQDVSFLIPSLQGSHGYFVSVAMIDSAGIMSPFSGELVKVNDTATPIGTPDDLPYGLNCIPIGIAERQREVSGVEMLPCAPDPFIDRTEIRIQVNANAFTGKATLLCVDAHGKEIGTQAISLKQGLNTTIFHLDAAPGLYRLILTQNGSVLASQSVVRMTAR